MNTPNETNTQTDLDRVLAKIADIVEKSADGDYIYRGEPERYEKVSSTLYREYPHREGTHFDIVSAQETILAEAKAYISKTDDIDQTDDIGILTELQHFGGKTNLIDFTEDYLIALFFACDGSHDEEGRVILLKRKSDDYEIREPQRTIDRVKFQKSIFVESPTGVVEVETDNEVTIPVALKMPMLDYLQKYHRISIATIYNDLHGFIRRSAYGEFLKGLTWQRKSEEAKTSKEKQEHSENAIKHYTEALKLNSKFTAAYYNRGITYRVKGDFEKAIADYNTAIELNPDYADAYNNRGLAYKAKGDFDRAIADFSKAIALKPEDAKAYNNRGIAYAENGDFDRAIADYTKAIALKPEDAEVYTNRGLAYARNGDFTTAIKDFGKAIELNPEDAEAYCNRGEAWLHLQEWEKSRADLTTAKNMGVDIASSFHNDYESVEDFEEQHGVKVPEDIAALLRRD